MKKKDIIELLQQKEAASYLDLQMCIDNFGRDDQYTKQSRTRWGMLNEIMEEINVKPNRELEATKQAEKMVLNRYKKEFA